MSLFHSTLFSLSYKALIVIANFFMIPMESSAQLANSSYKVKHFRYKDPDPPYCPPSIFNYSQMKILTESLDATKQYSLKNVKVKAHTCKHFQEAENKNQLTKAFKHLYSKMLEDAKYSSRSDGNYWNDCDPEEDSKALIITFSGTAEYAPALSSIMNYGLKCMKDNQKTKKLIDDYYTAAQRALAKSNSSRINSINKGITPLFLKDTVLLHNSAFIDFATFRSEEKAFMAGKTMGERVEDLIFTDDPAKPVGIQNAVQCITGYLKKAKELGINPKIIVMGHSSGSRSTVKFHEELKKIVNPITGKKNIRVDLAFTIDPVIEAHDELGYTLGKKIPGGHGVIEWSQVVEWFQKEAQKKLLYKPSNSERFVSVYQKKDTYGAGIIPDNAEWVISEAAIRGSAVQGADINKQVMNFKKDPKDSKVHAHGNITSHYETQQLFIKELYSIFLNP